jgi:UDP-N-acetylglucosamine--N-acetylmuramyl-(pentapeptide) pyrophosphoryl-undecaprenol N-acetylglucosamine transferase
MEEELVQREGIPFRAISAAGVHGVGVRALPGNFRKLVQGYRQSSAILRDYRPDALLFTGGYLAVPVALAAAGYRKILYVPDIQPGLALQVLAYISSRIALTVEESRKYFQPWLANRLHVTGYPLRPDLKRWSRPLAQEKLSLKPDLPTLLVTGGSKGARSINQAILSALPELLPFMQIIHLTGSLDWESVQEKRTVYLEDASMTGLMERYYPFSFLHDMGAALAAADLVVSRAGASTLGEYPFFGLPAILVPYPHAWKYQKVNASWMVEHGAAVVLNDEALSTELAGLVKKILMDPLMLEKMRSASRSLSRPDAAEKIADLVILEGKPMNRSDP